jgi:hypothetical protein
MPRNISVNRKSFEALSRLLSPSSIRLGVGNLNPVGGGPDGVACCRALHEKWVAAGTVNRVLLK